jgi:coniferyl-aldehyde dehydrogenase
MVQQTFERIKSASLRQPMIPYSERIDTLKKIERILIENEREICDCVSNDFGHRSRHETRILEISTLILGLRYTRKHLKDWMKPQKRHVSLMFLGAKNRVIPQAKGVVGIISPWNYPLFLALSPLTSAIAAGNRVMVKQAANSQRLCRLLQEKFSDRISENLISILPGVSAGDFCSVPYDHLVFTGSPAVGRQVMRTASQFLTPVTLELGGKSPTVVLDDFDLKTAVQRILFGKLINAGQTCIAPDYVFVPEKKVDAFIEFAKTVAVSRYPSIESDDYSAVIDDKAEHRLSVTLTDAVAKGAEIIELLPDAEGYSGRHRKRVPVVVKGVTDDMIIMQEEIFGPLLPIKPYQTLKEVLAYINAHERPLALYIFTHDRQVQERFLSDTRSGGVCVNDCTYHVAQHDMPFGGIGNSGLGQYHAYEGFVEFSKLRPVFYQASKTLSIAPPYGRLVERVFGMITRGFG